MKVVHRYMIFLIVLDIVQSVIFEHQQLSLGVENNAMKFQNTTAYLITEALNNGYYSSNRGM
jgi:hypothetical protein